MEEDSLNLDYGRLWGKEKGKEKEKERNTNLGEEDELGRLDEREDFIEKGKGKTLSLFAY